MSNQENTFARLASIDVGKHIEKKGNLSYLSWSWAVDQLLRQDPVATWEYKEPVKWGDTVMVFCSVTAFGVTRTAQLPVMDNKNKAIVNPDAFEVNKAMQRCLAKGIALHGLGLYVYNGEDLPQEDPAVRESKVADLFATLLQAAESGGKPEFTKAWMAADKGLRHELASDQDSMTRLNKACENYASQTEEKAA